jgi:hypothetical protein
LAVKAEYKGSIKPDAVSSVASLPHHCLKILRSLQRIDVLYSLRAYESIASLKVSWQLSILNITKDVAIDLVEI